MFKKIKFGFLIFSFLFSLFLINADSNGVWHYASDISGGIFGSDEQPITNYTFINKVHFENNIYINKIIDNKNNAYFLNLSGSSNFNSLIGKNLIVNNSVGIGTNNPRAKLDLLRK